MGIARRCFEAVGFFDERLVNNAEDTDYCYRSLQKGFRVTSTPRLVVPHLAGSTRRDLDKGQMERSARKFRRKYLKYQNQLPMPPIYPFG